MKQLLDAEVTVVHPLVLGDYGIVWVEKQLMIGRGINGNPEFDSYR